MNRQHLSFSEKKAICDMYHKGNSVNEIQKITKHARSTIYACLRKFYSGFYGQPFHPTRLQIEKRLYDLFISYQAIYKPFVYSREDICEELHCTIHELESMFRKYKLSHQRLCTYAGQVTLCNTSKMFRDSVSEFAKAHGYSSVRAVVTQAVNEFMLYHGGLEDGSEQ